MKNHQARFCISSMRSLLLFAILLANLWAPLLLRADTAKSWQGVYLGVGVEQENEGLVVSSVRKDTPAESALLKVDDRIVRFGDFRIPADEPRAAFIDYLKKLQPSEPVKITVLREGNEVDLRIVPAPLVMNDALAIAARLESNRVLKKYAGENGATDILDGLQARLQECVRDSSSTRGAYERINQVLDKLDVSHLAVIPAKVNQQLRGKKAGSYRLGMTLQRHGVAGKKRLFVRDMLDGGAAAKSGLKIGDEVVSIDTVPAEDSPRKAQAGYEWRHQMYRILAKKGETLKIGYRRIRGGPVRTVDVTISEPVGAVSATLESVRPIFVEDRVYGYVHVWNVLSSDIAELVESATTTLFKECDGLIIDLRGRGGQVHVMSRVIEHAKKSNLPMVALIDSQTRSAKEIGAFQIKRRKLGKLVGVRTTGGVTGATFAALPSGASLMYPVVDGDRLSRLTGGVSLEGRGVKPDIKVDFSLPYSAGKDSILSRGLQVLDRQVTAALEKQPS